MPLFGTDLVMGPSGELVTMSAVSTMGKQGWWQYEPIHEPFPGAWQRVMPERTENVLAFSAVFACISLISGDIAKLRIKLAELKEGIWEEVTNSAYSPVLRKPNHFQTRIQFLQYWIASKLLQGNAYILKERDESSKVRKLYPLDPRLVAPLVTDDGDVWYQINVDNLSGTTKELTVPASEIIHDRGPTLFHPLVGVSPIYACAMSATQGRKIQSNSATFFENMSRPSGQLTAPGKISPETKASLKEQFEREFSGGNLGRLLVSGDGLKYEAMTIPARDAQLIESLRWTVEDVARAFQMPLHKLAAGNPTVANAAQYNQEYYSHTLQKHIEDIELLLDEGLGLGVGNNYGVELDLDGLLRMDAKTQAETNAIEIGSAAMTPDEARASRNRKPVKGGDTPYLQQQNYSLAALAKRDERPDPFATSTPPKPAAPEEDDAEAEMRALMETLRKGFEYEV